MSKYSNLEDPIERGKSMYWIKKIFKLIPTIFKMIRKTIMIINIEDKITNILFISFFLIK